MKFRNPLTSGIGIYFTAYENTGACQIAELFAMTNYATTACDSFRYEQYRQAVQPFSRVRATPLLLSRPRTPNLGDWRRRERRRG